MEPTLLAKQIELGQLLVARLEKLSPDSRWARRASGSRGNLLKLLDELQEQMNQGQAVQSPDVQRLDSLINFGFFILEKAAREILAG